MSTYLKLIYYSIYAIAYGLVGSLSDLVMVNSSWTHSHISYLWRFAKSRMHIVYPPCDTDSLRKLDMEDRENLILSIGQFRPEKDHALQIKAFAKMRNIAEGRDQLTDFKLILVGSCRGKEDQDRVKILRELAESLNVTENVEFVLNQPFPVLKDYFGTASVGLHTMWNEHFGIGVVEMMAAGLITIAHNSGGPKADIIVPYSEKKLLTGYLASTEKEYANAMLDACIIGMNNEKSRILRQSAQESSQRFSDAIFNTSFKLLISKFCTAS